MADISKRTKKARKQAAKRAKKTRRRAAVGAKATRKAAAKTSMRTRAQAAAGLLVAAGVATALARLLKGSSDDEDAQRYSDQPDGLPNEPDRPVGTTPPPGAGTRETGADTGSLTETERTRVEQTG